MSKTKKQSKYCNCHNSSNKAILKSNVTHSFCEKCGCILLKSEEGTIYFTLETKQKRHPNDLSPITIIKNMKKKTEEGYPHIYEEFNINKSDLLTKEKTVQSINIYLKFRKMILIKLQKLMKDFDYCDMSFYQSLFFLDNYLSHKMTEDMSEKTVLYYLVGYFLCAVKFKETDIYEPSFDSFFDLSKGIYLSTERIAYYEILCLKNIEYNVFSYSAYDWMTQLISNGIIFNCEVNNSNEVVIIKGHRHSIINTINKYAIKLLLNLTSKSLFFKYSPMYIAISLIQIAREKYIDKNLINEKLFLKLINLYGIKIDDYKKCYDEIKLEMKDFSMENENAHIDKEKENKNNGFENISDIHLPDLRGNERNESTKKFNRGKNGKNLYVPNKLKSSNVITKVKDNPIVNSKTKDDTKNEDSKENENQKEENIIELSLNEVDSKKKYKLKTKNVNNTELLNPAGRLSINCKTNIFRSNDNLPKIKVNSKERYSVFTQNNEEKIEPNHPKVNVSYSKDKKRPVLKELTHIKSNALRHHSIKKEESHSNSITLNTTEKESEIEKSNIKKKSKFFTGSNKILKDKNLDFDFKRKNIQTSTKLPLITGFDSLNGDRIETNIGEYNKNNQANKTKKHYKLKKHIDNLEIKSMPEEDEKAKSTKKLLEVL